MLRIKSILLEHSISMGYRIIDYSLSLYLNEQIKISFQYKYANVTKITDQIENVCYMKIFSR